MNSENRGGGEPSASLHLENKPEKPSRRKFLKMFGIAGAAVLAGQVLPKGLAKSKESSGDVAGNSVELRGERLPNYVQKAISENNHKYKDHTITSGDVVYVLNQQQYIETNSITNPIEKRVLSHDLMYFKDEREKKVMVIGDSFMMRSLNEQSKQEGCGDLSQILLNAAMIHEATHFHGGNEEVAYEAQIKYLKEQLQIAKMKGATGHYTTQFFVYLSNYIKPYKEHLEKIKKGEAPNDPQKLAA